MTAPIAVEETYVSCAGSSFIFDPGGSDLTLKVIEGGLTLTMATDDMTNSGSGGWSEDVGTIKSAKGSFTAAYVSGVVPPFTPGVIYNAQIKNSTSPSFTANWRFAEFELPLLNVKEGLKYKFSITNQGAVTIA